MKPRMIHCRSFSGHLYRPSKITEVSCSKIDNRNLKAVGEEIGVVTVATSNIEVMIQKS